MSRWPPSVNVGPGFFGLLTILFVGLKLTGHIDWSWWWVLLPVWGPILLLLFLAAMAYIIWKVLK